MVSGGGLLSDDTDGQMQEVTDRTNSNIASAELGGNVNNYYEVQFLAFCVQHSKWNMHLVY